MYISQLTIMKTKLLVTIHKTTHNIGETLSRLVVLVKTGDLIRNSFGSVLNCNRNCSPTAFSELAI